MYGKIFTQIYDSSIAENYQTRLVFQDLIILADMNGVVDMTHEAIARRTNVPIEVVKQAIDELEKPDPRSRSPIELGARIVRLDEHRDWGWIIVNHQRFRDMATETVRREKTRERVKKFREKNNLGSCNAPVTLGNAKVPIQIQKQIQIHIEEPEGAGVENSVELPSTFPKTMDDAIARCGSLGCGPVFITDTWNKAVSRGGTDAKGQIIRSFSHYVQTEWKYEKDRKEREKHATNQIHQRNSSGRPDRNAGTLNAGTAEQYDLKKIQANRKLPDVQRAGAGATAG